MGIITVQPHGACVQPCCVSICLSGSEMISYPPDSSETPKSTPKLDIMESCIQTLNFNRKSILNSISSCPQNHLVNCIKISPCYAPWSLLLVTDDRPLQDICIKSNLHKIVTLCFVHKRTDVLLYFSTCKI